MKKVLCQIIYVLLSLFDKIAFFLPTEMKNDSKIAFTGFLFGKTGNVLDYAIHQIKHECNGYDSNLYRDANNVSGMQVPNIRYSFGITGTWTNSEGSAMYKSVNHSIIDYWLRQIEFKLKNSYPNLSAFNDWLDNSGYYSDTPANYLSGMSSWGITPASTGVTVVFSVLIASGFVAYAAIYKLVKKRWPKIDLSFLKKGSKSAYG